MYFEPNRSIEEKNASVYYNCAYSIYLFSFHLISRFSCYFRTRQDKRLFRRIDRLLLPLLRVLHEKLVLVRLTRPCHMASAHFGLQEVHDRRDLQYDLEYGDYRGVETWEHGFMLQMGSFRLGHGCGRMSKAAVSRRAWYQPNNKPTRTCLL